MAVWKLLIMVVGVKDDMLLAMTDTLAAAQGPGREVAEDVSKHII
jgi:hypothetical protein